MEIALPYGKSHLPLFLNDNDSVIVAHPKESPAIENINKFITSVIKNPLGIGPLSTVVSKGQKIVIVVDDYTRPAPTKQLLPPLLNELIECGINKTDITIIIATGTHTPPDYEKMIQILGKEIVNDYAVISNDVKNGAYLSLGTSSYGNKISVLKEYVQADIKILVGDIEYHYYAGYGGTRKSVLPGVSSAESIQTNHAMMFHSNAVMGIYDINPISKEMIEAMDMAGCDFALSAVLNSHHDIVGLWAGDPKLVMEKGIALVDKMFKMNLCQQPDIVISAADGSPHDINLYQALKALYTASQIVREKGVVILIAECPEGIGNALYATWLENHTTAAEIQVLLEKNFKLGAHKAFYHRQAIEKNTVILVSELQDGFVKDKLGFIPAKTPEDALRKAYNITGPNASILISPRGSTSYFECKK